jgi:4-carboxymuconolactone decarboxylase
MTSDPVTDPRFPCGPPRVPAIPLRLMDAEQVALYRAIVGGRRGQGPQHFPLVAADGCLTGPFNAMLLSPSLGGAVQALGAAVRFQGTLTRRERELAVLAVAAHWGSRFEWGAHAGIALDAGLSNAQLAAVLAGHPVPGCTPHEAALLAWVRELVRGWRAGEAAFDQARGALGLPAAYEAAVLVGYYSLLALLLRVFDGEHPGDQPVGRESADDGN